MAPFSISCFLDRNLYRLAQNNLVLLPVFQVKYIIKEVLKQWVNKFNSFKKNHKNIVDGLISKDWKKLFIKYNFIQEIIDITNKSEEQVKNNLMT
ncbi:MAG: hypothetical protein JSV23_04030 [Promethearchaeota archaeon]|nr:MAG: hypothetical protein JSV23_04030 [Candidatus Lokiarchaeota archaeon]